MSSEKTAAEVQQAYIGTMGSELGGLFFGLSNECASLHWKWEEFVSLFGTSPQRTELLNKSAGAFFRIVQETLWDSVLLHIARLMDSPQSVGKENLCLPRLGSLVSASVRADVERDFQDCSAKCKFARDWRNRRIAHRDLALALRHPSALPLQLANEKLVQEALKSITVVLNTVQLHYQGSKTIYRVEPPGNASALLHLLQAGLQWEEDRHKRLRSGMFTPEDLKRLPPI
jgi:hypothetical protein